MSLDLKTKVKNFTGFLVDSRFHHLQIAQARELLKNIESENGKTPESHIKMANEYAVEVLGHKRFAPWLHVYSAVAGTFKEGWIPDNFYGSVVVPAVQGCYGPVSDIKQLNKTIFGSDLFPDIGSYVNGIFLDEELSLIPAHKVSKVLFDKTEKVVFKIENSLQGRGIYFFTRETFDPQLIRRLGNGLFQSYIPQHDLFASFARESVATLRITTVFQDNGVVSVRACYLRLGSGNDTHVQSRSHVRVPIDIETGKFADQGFLTSWVKVDSHPTSKVSFRGHQIPCFENCIAIVKELHKKVPYSRCVGWDVIVDQWNHVRVMEWNSGHNDIKFGEATQGPCFEDMGWERLRRGFSLF